MFKAPFRALLVVLGLILISVCMIGGDAEAVAIRKWTGFGGPSLVFSDPNNWDGHTNIAAGDLIEFPFNSVEGEITNDLVGLHLGRMTFTAKQHVLKGNPIDVDDIDATGGSPTIELNITGQTRILVGEFGDLTLSGANTFSGKIDLYGELYANSDQALGSTAGTTQINSGGRLFMNGRDFGNEHIIVESPEPLLAFCAIENDGGISFLRYLLISGKACILNGGTINYPSSVHEYFAPFDLYLIGGTHVFDGPTEATGAIRLAGPTNIVWNSTGAVDLSTKELVDTFAASGDLSGTGTAASVDFYSGTFSPGQGNTPGTFTIIDSLNLHDATFSTRLNSTAAGSGYSQVKAGGPVTIGPETSLNVSLGFTPGANQSFRIIDNTGTQAISGTFKGLPEGATFSLGGKNWDITYKGGTGNDVVISTAAATPPPPPSDPRPFKRVVPMVAKNP